MASTAFELAIDDTTVVSALSLAPHAARASYAFAHGAGAGMDHAFMESFAIGLADRGVATLRFNFPYWQRGERRVDKPEVAHRAIRAACAEASRRFDGLPLFAGGKSFGGRMTSQAQAAASIDGVLGLVFVGFPLHPAGKPTIDRAEHLAGVDCPMLFLQGTRDELAQLDLVEGVVQSLAPLATIDVFLDADHAFHVRKSSGTDDAATRTAMLDSTARWIEARLA